MRERLQKLRRDKAPKMSDAEREARHGDENHLGLDRANAIKGQFASWLLDPSVARQTDQTTVETHPTPEQAEHYKALLLQGAHGLASGELRGSAVGELMLAAEMLGGTYMPDGRRLVMKDESLASQAFLVGTMAKSVAYMEMSTPYRDEQGRLETSMYPGWEAQQEAVRMMNDSAVGLAGAHEGAMSGNMLLGGANPEETAEVFNGVASRLNSVARAQGMVPGSVEQATGKMLFMDPVRTIGAYGEDGRRVLAVNPPVYREDRGLSTS